MATLQIADKPTLDEVNSKLNDVAKSSDLSGTPVTQQLRLSKVGTYTVTGRFRFKRAYGVQIAFNISINGVQHVSVGNSGSQAYVFPSVPTNNGGTLLAWSSVNAHDGVNLNEFEWVEVNGTLTVNITGVGSVPHFVMVYDLYE